MNDFSTTPEAGLRDVEQRNISRTVRKRTLGHVPPRKNSLRIRAVLSESSLSAWKKKLCILGYPKMRIVKILIRVRECAGWSEALLVAHVRSYVFWSCGSYLTIEYIDIHESRALGKYAFEEYADTEGPDQPAHPRSLISTFAVRLQNHWVLQNIHVFMYSKDAYQIVQIQIVFFFVQILWLFFVLFF